MIEKILIVGNGSIAKKHFEVAKKILPLSDIRFLVRSSTLNFDLPKEKYFFKIKEAIEFQPNVAVIANPATFHISIAETLSEIGVHLLIEKPLSTSLLSTTDLLNKCNIKNTVLSVGYNLRHLPSLQLFRDLITSEKLIGRVLSFRCEVGQYLPSWRPDKDYRLTVSSSKKLGGGVLLELSHELDYLRWIFGEVDWIISNLSKQSDLDIDVEDTAHLILGFKNIDNNQLVGVLNLDFIRHDYTRSCIVIGENGSLLWNGLNQEISVFLKGKKKWRKVFLENNNKNISYENEWIDFIDCVENNKKPLVSGIDGLRVMQIIEAAKLSFKKSSKIHIDKINK